MASPVVDRATAMGRRTHHQFLPGIGYIAHSGPPALPDRPPGTKSCKPPAGTKDGSVHLMKPGTGGPPIRMLWIAGEGAWASLKIGKGNRLAWSAAFLTAAGWEYGGVAPA